MNDSPTARKIREALPITGRVNTWGDEIYFEITVQMEDAAAARADVKVGEVVGRVLGDAADFRQVDAGVMVTLTEVVPG